MPKFYWAIVAIWATALAVFLAFQGHLLYEIKREEALVEEIGYTQAKSANQRYSYEDAYAAFSYEGEIKTSIKEYAAIYYLAIPEKLRNRFLQDGWKLILTDKDIQETYYTGDVKGRLAGLTNYSEKTIYVHARKTDIRRSLLHEFGHYVDSVYGMVSASTEFDSIYKSEKIHLNEKWKIDSHATSNAQEFFAESFSMILIYSSQSQTDIPNTYAFINKAIQAF